MILAILACSRSPSGLTRPLSNPKGSMSVVSRWRDRLRIRQSLERAAKREHAEAQEALEEARRKDLHPRQHLVDRRDRASAKLTMRRAQVAYALRVIERHLRKGVRRPHERIKTTVRNQSSRGGSPIRLIVLHSTESHDRPGLDDVRAIVGWFDNPASSASSHVVVDGEGHSARCVTDSKKAWTQAAYNPVSLSIEMIGRAAQGRDEWETAQLRKVAQYLAYWSKKYGIPLKSSTTHGVCRHSDLGAAGGGHHDPGANFPMGYVLDLAKRYRSNGW